jgi:hypothetical protein
MSHSLCKTVQVMAFFVGTPIFYFVCFATIERRFGILRPSSPYVANAICGALFVLVWYLIWRRDVRWTRVRLRNTLISLLGTIAIAIGISYVVNPRWWVGSDLILAWACWAVLWISLTGVVWRETMAERLGRTEQARTRTLRCPSCGYNMTGLHDARCPECGTQYTLDQIVSSAIDVGQLSSE